MDELAARIDRHLRALIATAGHRPPGSPANRRATDYARSVLEAAGLVVEAAPFLARWWTPGRARLVVEGEGIPISPPPFCRAATVHGPAAHVDGLADLEHVDPGAVLVLRGDLAQPVFPKAFPFVRIPEQTALIEALEAARPAAVLAVTSEDAAQPVFEDPDLAFPYATIDVELGERIRAGRPVALEVESTLERGGGDNVAGGTFRGARTVVSAHIDSKVETAGALDNGGGVAAVLALAEAGLDDLGPVEVVLFNGEDHYAAPGEQAWLARRDLAEVELVVNIDGAGLRGHRAAVSSLAAPEGLEAAIARAAERLDGVTTGEPWFESDHAVFAMRGIPTVAITTAAPFDYLKRVAHAPDDDADRVDPVVLADVVRFVRALLEARVPAGR